MRRASVLFAAVTLAMWTASSAWPSASVLAPVTAQAQPTFSREAAENNVEDIVARRLDYNENERLDLVRSVVCRRGGVYWFRCRWSAGGDARGIFGSGRIRQEQDAQGFFRFPYRFDVTVVQVRFRPRLARRVVRRTVWRGP